jgi:DNA-binding transcriptional LysR family regulator
MTIDAAVQGMGIAFWIEQELKPLIEQGKLVSLLEECSAPFPGFYICYPQQRQMAPALRAFIDFVKDNAAER